MPVQSSLHVSLTPDLESFIQSRVDSGQFQTASEVISEGLRLLEQQEQARDEDFRLLKEKLERGAAQALRGEVVDGEAFMAERRQQLLNQIAAQRPRMPPWNEKSGSVLLTTPRLSAELTALPA